MEICQAEISRYRSDSVLIVKLQAIAPVGVCASLMNNGLEPFVENYRRVKTGVDRLSMYALVVNVITIASQIELFLTVFFILLLFLVHVELDLFKIIGSFESFTRNFSAI